MLLCCCGVLAADANSQKLKFGVARDALRFILRQPSQIRGVSWDRSSSILSYIIISIYICVYLLILYVMFEYRPLTTRAKSTWFRKAFCILSSLHKASCCLHCISWQYNNFEAYCGGSPNRCKYCQQSILQQGVGTCLAIPFRVVPIGTKLTRGQTVM